MIFPTGKKLDFTKPLVMGVVNVTPDSFSDGGLYLDQDKAVEHGLKLAGDGADILDIGGESSRPGSDPVSLEQELERVVPVVERLARGTEIPISVDTTKSVVADKTLKAGADIINDISAFRFDEKMAGIAAKSGSGVILMHMKGRPKDMQRGKIEYDDVVRDICSFFLERCKFAMDAGVGRSMLMIDPGIGFGKTLFHNLEIMKRLPEIVDLGFPVVVGTSRKSFLGKILDSPVRERLEGTLATVALSVFLGAGIVRVHDVAHAKKAALAAFAIAKPELYG
ncbi:MAG: dihydropteroate synthase [Deltaproteobacteria bacterium]|nr:dihydropteroate synthase [Deltaproteobacteria bacterium]